LRIPGQQLVGAQAHQHRLQALGQQIGQAGVDVGAAETGRSGVGGQLAQHQQAHQHAVETAMEQRREHLQQRLRAFQVVDLLDFVGRDVRLEVGLEAALGILLVQRRIGRGLTCYRFNHSLPFWSQRDCK
jgi:hypothetical protein